MLKKILILLILASSVAVAGVVLAQQETDIDDAPLEGVTIRPVSEIVDLDTIEFYNFRNDGTAQLSLITDIPVACTIVYGTTTEFGMLTFDQNMAAPTITDHNPILTGLEPDTTYYYRLQGTDDFGVMYISEVMTFETPALDTSVSENLAALSRGAEVIGYSSSFGDAELDARWGANSAFDDNPGTEWATSGDGDEAWIEVELAERASIEGVQFWSRAMNDGSSITVSFTLTVDGETEYGPFTIPDTNQAYEFDVAIEGQTLRFDLVETTGGNTGVVDIAVLGEFIE